VSPLFDKVLVANRGEIAVRILRTLRELGIPSVAIYSEADAGAPHVELADESRLVGPGPAAASYLDADAIIAACRSTGACALHPGYGFVSENAAFAHRCRDEAITFIGPTPEVIELMGDKIRARRLVAGLGVPVVPGTMEQVLRPDEAHALAEEIGYPVAIKAAGGGGGIGMRLARDAGALERALAAAQADGERFFGNGAVYVERYFEDPRHVEVQLLGDASGAVVHLGERDCTVQRRHQKLIEETPAPTADEPLRSRIAGLATTVARHIGYTSAGTIEGLLVGDEFYFLEMNTRLQVEHAITEAATGIDLVEQQLRVAAGHDLAITQAAVIPRGVAIECRINAEAAHRVFAPSPGTIDRYAEPTGPGVRIDSGVRAGSAVPPFYDSLLAKVIVWDETRSDATSRMLDALDAFEIDGIDTLLPFHRRLLRTEQWAEAGTCRDLLADRTWLRELAPA
jgi:acetyl-CoA/propionyl-CoA carboxylase, biotin carboxylase, biotin carboxyl carrier protein